MTPEQFMRQTGIPVLPFWEIDLTGPADMPVKPDPYVARLEHIYKLAAALKEAEETEAPRWQCVNAKHQLFAALEP